MIKTLADKFTDRVEFYDSSRKIIKNGDIIYMFGVCNCFGIVEYAQFDLFTYKDVSCLFYDDMKNSLNCEYDGKKHFGISIHIYNPLNKDELIPHSDYDNDFFALYLLDDEFRDLEIYTNFLIVNYDNIKERYSDSISSKFVEIQKLIITNQRNKLYTVYGKEKENE